MTEKQLKEITNKWKVRLGLDEWRIALKFSETVKVKNDDVFMHIHRSTFYKRATLEISKYVLDPSSLPECIEKDLLENGFFTHQENVEVAVVHELLHCALRDLMETSDLIRDQLGESVASVWDGAWSRAEENIVENLAIALVRNWST